MFLSSHFLTFSLYIKYKCKFIANIYSIQNSVLAFWQLKYKYLNIIWIQLKRCVKIKWIGRELINQWDENIKKKRHRPDLD